MPYTVKVNQGYNNVALPDGRSYDGGQTVTLSDEDYGDLSPSMFSGNLPILSDEGSSPIAGIPSEDWDDPSKKVTGDFGVRVVDQESNGVASGQSGGLLIQAGPQSFSGNLNLFGSDDSDGPYIIREITALPESFPALDDPRWEPLVTNEGGFVYFYEAGGENPIEGDDAVAFEMGGLLRLTATYDGIPFSQYVWLDPSATIDPVDLGGTALYDNDSQQWQSGNVDLNFKGRPRKVIPVLQVEEGDNFTYGFVISRLGAQQNPVLLENYIEFSIRRVDEAVDPGDEVTLYNDDGGSTPLLPGTTYGPFRSPVPFKPTPWAGDTGNRIIASGNAQYDIWGTRITTA